ncbi:HAD-IA family hydrolase [Bifidobacterium sp. ESL0790]|uniref:HAD-IA family hydrolase n=1 Tax=Bifidobacterium sp. ESL0790 TaxID=2983233 RepID=UPI0023F9E907|nr:HAD-IA family hydrolase [Bifidobacterium sp. ESL0790]WEV72037.1 HAD-IA family hydrolase [Bifidobacterium sp. ESL0790]
MGVEQNETENKAEGMVAQNISNTNPAMAGNGSEPSKPDKPFTWRLEDFDAALFDLDGVLTPTVNLHKEAWKRLFISVLPDDVAPYTDEDYFKYVDGKPRYDGVDALMRSRGIVLEHGNPEDTPDQNTICGLGNRKNEEFERLLHEQGIEPYDDVVDVLQHLRAVGKKLAVVSSSRNAREVLLAAGILKYFDIVVDGNVRAQHNLAGKPAPDTYQYASRSFRVRYSRSIVLEDALSGVASGAAGHFGLVVGVDRGAGRQALLDAGANIVVTELGQLLDGKYETSDPTTPGHLDTEKYPIDPWSFTQYGEPSEESATLFSVSNGSIGVRAESGQPRDLGSGTFISGFHETFAIRHAEEAYGFARIGQVVQGVPDTSDFRFSVGGRVLTAPGCYKQSVDFKQGTATRSYRYEVGENASLEVEITTMACLFRADLLVNTIKLHAVGESLKVHVAAPINVQHPEVSRDVDPRKADLIADGGLRKLEVDAVSQSDKNETFGAYHCKHSGCTMAVGVAQRADGASVPQTFDIEVVNGQTATVVRYSAYNNHRVTPIGVRKGLKAVGRNGRNSVVLFQRCASTLAWAEREGLDSLCTLQRQWLERFWSQADINVEADDGGRTQQVLRWEIFQLAQTTAFVPNGIAAKGLSGTGYSGHYFWDTEAFIVPFLTYNSPDRAKDALDFRYRMLPAARKRAATMNVDGALFPWRTINGEEASAFFEAGTAQYHIDADIAYAVCQYVSATGDMEFMGEKGIDILVETARMWASLGYMGPDGQFHINTVTGPDEYSALVDDNYYTNVMAQYNLRAAVRALGDLDDQQRSEAVKRLQILSDESSHWLEVADAMTLPVDSETGIHLQDADFLNRQTWDFKHNTLRPLLLHYHPMMIYRHQVLKQTDTVLALYLLSQQFDLPSKLRDFDFYDPLTTGDSSLSASAQQIIAAEVGHDELAMKYFDEALYADVANLHGNTSDGIHLASAGGVWLSVVSGFGGLRDSGGQGLTLDPRLPGEWKSLTYRIRVHGSLLEVTVRAGGVDIQRLSGDPVSLVVEGEKRTV